MALLREHEALLEAKSPVKVVLVPAMTLALCVYQSAGNITFDRMYKVTNLLIGFISVIPGIIMALGFWNMVSTLPEVPQMISKTLGSFVIIAVIAFLQPVKAVKKISQLGIAVGFLWTLTALLLDLEL